MNMKAKAYFNRCLDNNESFVIKAEIPAEQIAVFTKNLFFHWQQDVAGCAEAVRETVKEAGKKYFVVACSSSYLMEDMGHILASGLGKMAGHAFIYRKACIFREEELEGAGVVFELA